MWKTVKHISKGICPLGQDLNLVPLEPKERMLNTEHQFSISIITLIIKIIIIIIISTTTTTTTTTTTVILKGFYQICFELQYPIFNSLDFPIIILLQNIIISLASNPPTRS
jgi:hypothetical protein